VYCGATHNFTLDGMIPAFPWPLLLLKLAALFSFCGGPLVLADSLKAHMDKDPAFAIAFVPTVALIFGVYSLWEAVPNRWDDAMVILGALGATVLVGMNVFAVFELITSPERADGGLIKLGIAVGIVFVAYYAHASRRFFISRRSAA
jgi:hypothetical protein